MYINNYLGNHNDMYSFFLVNPRINREPHYYTFFVFTYLVYLPNEDKFYSTRDRNMSATTI